MDNEFLWQAVLPHLKDLKKHNSFASLDTRLESYYVL